MYSDLPKNISILYRKMCVALNERFAVIGLSTSKAMFLICLNQYGTLSQSELCKKLDMDRAAVAKAISLLENDGFITKRVNPNDIRAYLVTATEKANELIPQIKQIQTEWVDSITEKMTDIEKDIFINLLQKATENVSQT